MRLDKILQLCGVLKRRTIANEACKLGYVKVNGLVAKPTKIVKVNDIIELNLPTRQFTIHVLQELPKNRSISKDEKYMFFSIEQRNLNSNFENNSNNNT